MLTKNKRCELGNVSSVSIKERLRVLKSPVVVVFVVDVDIVVVVVVNVVVIVN